MSTDTDTDNTPDLAAIEARYKAATPEPNSRAHEAIEDIPALLAEVRRLTAERDELQRRAEAAEAEANRRGFWPYYPDVKH